MKTQSEPSQNSSCPLFFSPVHAGFPSPADDFIDQNLDLNEYLVKHPAATFFVRVDGNSMIRAGIQPGDILVVDRALKPEDRSVVIASVDGEFTVKRVHKVGNALYLQPENPKAQKIQITGDMDFELWGVVTHAIHHVK